MSNANIFASDNGLPTSFTNARFGFSRLSTADGACIARIGRICDEVGNVREDVLECYDPIREMQVALAGKSPEPRRLETPELAQAWYAQVCLVLTLTHGGINLATQR